jgi:hypothetical protein
MVSLSQPVLAGVGYVILKHPIIMVPALQIALAPLTWSMVFDAAEPFARNSIPNGNKLIAVVAALEAAPYRWM